MLCDEPGLSDEIDNLSELIEAAAEGGVLEDFTVQIFGNQGKSPDQINLMTLHSSKGLEYQAVIMLGLEEGVSRANTLRRAKHIRRPRACFTWV